MFELLIVLRTGSALNAGAGNGVGSESSPDTVLRGVAVGVAPLVFFFRTDLTEEYTPGVALPNAPEL